MTSSFLNNIGYQKPKSEQERFLESIAPGGDYTMPPDKPKKSRGVQPSAGWKNAVAAQKEAVTLGRQLRPDGASAYYGPGGNPDGSGRGQAQRRSGDIGLMGPDGEPFDPTRKPTPTKPEGEGLTGRNDKRGGATGTQMSPKGADFGAFQKTLEDKYGVNFNFDQGRGGMQSISLPNTAGNVPDTSSGNVIRVTNGQNEGNYVKVDNPDFDKIIRGEVVGGFSNGQGVQGGTSSAADVGDQSRALRFDASKYKEDPERPQDIYETADVGLDRRSRAFLDYDGPGGSMMALRAAEASQGTIKQNGKVYAVGSDGNWGALSDEGAAGLKTDRNKVAAQDYADKFKAAVADPAQAQSPDSGAPVANSRETYMQMMDKEMPGTMYVPNENNEAETFNPNVSAITGKPSQFGLDDADYFNDKPTGEPNKSWLPSEDEYEAREELMRKVYI
jgi:hypothetical protein